MAYALNNKIHVKLKFEGRVPDRLVEKGDLIVVSANSSVYSLKELICLRNCIPIRDICILWTNKLLSENSALSDIGELFEKDPLLTIQVKPYEFNSSECLGLEPECESGPQTLPVGWTCSQCTVRNFPSRPGCEVCTNSRPKDYIVPVHYERTPEEQKFLHQRSMEEADRIKMEKQHKIEQRRTLAALVKQTQKSVVFNIEPFDCEICLESIDVAEGIILHECLHSFCLACLKQYIATESQENAEITCPLGECDQVIVPAEINWICRYAPEVRAKLEQNDIRYAEGILPNTAHCLTPDCKVFVQFDGPATRFDCTKCGQTNCIPCGNQHTGMTCQEYEQNNMTRRLRDENVQTADQLRDMLLNKRAQNCPQCNTIIEKNGGCPNMICTQCHRRFVWQGPN